MAKLGWHTAILSAGLLAIGGAALAGDNDRIEDRIERRLQGIDGEVQVQIREGAVILEGAVTNLHDARDAVKAAKREAKGLEVENRIRIVPPEERRRLDLAVERAILRSVNYTVFDSVGYSLDHGAVTLTGSVQQGFHSHDIEDQVAKVKGVREIRNQIKVQSVSLFDDRLRRQLYVAIYGDVLRPFGSMVNPPVRIVVDGGRVTLTGSVTSRLEQVRLGMAARETLAFGVNNLVEVESEKDRKPVRSNT